VFCTKCGQPNADDSRFCAQCGAPLAGERPAEQTSTIALGALVEPESDDTDHGHDEALDGLAAGTGLLVVKRGPNAGSRFLLDRDTTTAGRHPESDIFLDDVTVSRRHAEFRRQDGAFAVHDVGSLNGTYLNRDRVDRGRLNSGDEVQIGKFRLVFLSGPEAGSA
jgi:pSer/pThr/pTyr-binding forkhead associated (FHA) protein